MEQGAVTQEVLRTDVAGMPLEWIDYRDAVRLYHTEQVAYVCGSPIYRIRGGRNAKTGLRSVIVVSSIIATHGCLLYTSPSPRDLSTSRMPSSA